jgi:hypothetical protein
MPTNFKRKTYAKTKFMQLKNNYWCICLFVLSITTSKPFIPTFESTNLPFTNNTWTNVQMSICYHIIIKNYNFLSYNVTNNKTLEDLNSMILITTNKYTTQWFCYWIQYNQRRIYVNFGTLKVSCFQACCSTTYKTFVGTIFNILWIDLLSLHFFRQGDNSDKISTFYEEIVLFASLGWGWQCYCQVISHLGFQNRKMILCMLKVLS